MPQGRTPREVMMEYQTRSIVLSPKIDLGRCSYEQMKFWLEVIQTMLHEALTLPLPVGATSKTYEQIREAVCRTKFLSRPKTKNKMKGIWRFMYTMQLVSYYYCSKGKAEKKILLADHYHCCLVPDCPCARSSCLSTWLP